MGNTKRVVPRSLTHGHEKLKPNIHNSGGNILKRLRIDPGCNAIAAAEISPTL
jgi:hypothetical protein